MLPGDREKEHGTQTFGNLRSCDCASKNNKWEAEVQKEKEAWKCMRFSALSKPRRMHPTGCWSSQPFSPSTAIGWLPVSDWEVQIRAGVTVDKPSGEEMESECVDMPGVIDASVRRAGALQELRWIDLDELLFKRRFGEGSYGIVDEYEWMGRRVAVKTLAWKGREILEHEAVLLTQVQRHPNVVEFLGCAFDEERKKGMLVMELASQDLRSLLDTRRRGDRRQAAPFSLRVAVDVMKQVTNGLKHLRQLRVLHRDLKSMNILVNPRPRNSSSAESYYDVKLSDFGRSKCNEQDSLFSSVVAPPRWRAPEVFRDKDMISSSYTWSSDVYSFAMVCYEILSGDLPFQDVAMEELLEAISDGERPELPANCPDDLVELIEECWDTDPAKRPDIAAVHRRLSAMAP